MKLFRKTPAQPALATPRVQAEAAPPRVPEIAVADVIEQRRNGVEVHLLDCRESFERAQVRIPGSLHIPMNDLPARLSELDATVPWVVVCAHGNRSYSVAAYLLRNGIEAGSLAGGITDWWIRGGETESNFRR